MKKLVIAAADEDIAYLRMLAHYAASSEYAERLELHCFTGKDSLDNHMAESGLIDILLASPALVPGRSPLPSVRSLQLLTEVQLEDDAKQGTYVYKYQPLHRLFAQMLAVYEEQTLLTGAIVPTGGSTTQVISVYSTTGGSGKTVTALHLARYLGQAGHKVMYLNFETVNAACEYMNVTDRHDFSKLLYYWRTNPQQWVAKFEQLKQYDPALLINYIEPAAQMREMMELGANDVRGMVQALSAARRYDYIVLDLDSSPHEGTFGALAAGHSIWWLLQDDVQYLRKTDRLLQHFDSLAQEKGAELRSRIRFILNKYTGSAGNSYERLGIRITGRLPYIPQWKTVTATSQWFIPVFADGIASLCRAEGCAAGAQ